MAVSLKYFIDATDKSGKAIGSAKSGLDGLADSAKKVASTLALGFAADQIADVARLGATAERVEQRFNAFAKEAGGATAILEAFQKGAGGAAGKMDSMASASKLLQMGLVEDAAGMERVVEMATRMGDQTQGVSDRVADFALMLANTSIPRLDNFGISSGKVRARIAELTTGVNALSREEAFMAAVMEEGGQALEKLGPRADDGLMSFEKLEAQMADMKVEIGQALLPAMTSLITVFAEVLTAAQPLIDTFAHLTRGLGEMEAQIASTEGIASTMGDQFNELVAGGMEAGDALELMAAKMDEANAARKNLSNTEKAAINLLGRQGDLTYATSSAQTSLNEAIADGSSSYADYISKLNTFNRSAADTDSRIEAMTQTSFQWRKSWEAGTASMTEGQQAGLDLMAAVTAQYGTYTYANAQAYMAQQKQTEATQAQREALDAIRPAWMTENKIREQNIALSEQSTDRLREHESARRSLNQSTEASSAILANAAAEEERAAERQRQVASLEDMAASSAARLAEQQRTAAEATAAHAAEQGKLMVALTGATEEQLKQQVFAAIDPSQIGVDAYAQLGVELGVLDEKAANLATAVPQLVEAYNQGIIPTENMAAATTALYDAAGDADFNVGALLDQYAKAPGLIGPSADAAEDFATRLDAMGEPIDVAIMQLNQLAGAYSDVATQAGKVPTTIPSAGGGVPSFQGGGVMPGVPGGPHALAMMAPGERAVPLGMSVGPYGGPVHSVTTHNTYNVPSLLAAKMLATQQRTAALTRFEGR